jgi:small subunit ribosomal protein S20
MTLDNRPAIIKLFSPFVQSKTKGVASTTGDFVAHSLSAKKRVRQNARRNALNRHRKEVLKQDIKGFVAAITAHDPTKAAEQLNVVARRLDRVASKGVIHKNTAARKRSRLTKKLNVLKAGGKVKVA